MDISKYIYSHCVHPVKINAWDAYTQSFVCKEVSCGKCLHCRKTRVNEWVTRLYAQALDSAYTYYITLDYSPFSYEKDTFTDPTAHILAIETNAVWHNINFNHTYGMHPLLLRKHHFQNFIKRFRKNTHHNIQYFACGEYGTHAEGKGYGRPHFHAIIFSDSVITQSEFQDAWTLNGYKIGNVDFDDITLEAKYKFKSAKDNNAKHVFSYVCKYLQKGGFEFEKLATFNFHYALYESLAEIARQKESFDGITPELSAEKKRLLWTEYIKEFSPFIVCSRRPSIGFAYLQRNLERFKKGDFRLFGLPQECIAFPNYYVRKTKESFCEFVSLGAISQSPSSSSRIGHILSVLSAIRDNRLDLSRVRDIVPYNKRENISESSSIFLNGRCVCTSNLHFYDTKNNFMYQFNGYCYTLWAKVKKLGFVRVQEMDIIDVINEVKPRFQNYYDSYVTSMHRKKVLSETELYDYINTYFPGETYSDKYKYFQQKIYKELSHEESDSYNRLLYYKNSKISF